MMNNLKFFLFFIFVTVPSFVMACPNCAGSTNGKDKYTVAILSIFILLTYVPFYILFNLAKKSRMKTTLEKNQVTSIDDLKEKN
jgi:hypothetical protein